MAASSWACGSIARSSSIQAAAAALDRDAGACTIEDGLLDESEPGAVSDGVALRDAILERIEERRIRHDLTRDDHGVCGDKV